MNRKIKRRLTVAGIFLVHLLATAFVSFAMLGFILRRHHYGLSSSEVQRENGVKIASQIAEFPLMPLTQFALGSDALRFMPLIWMANSLLWAFCVYALINFIIRKSRRRGGIN